MARVSGRFGLVGLGVGFAVLIGCEPAALSEAQSRYLLVGSVESARGEALVTEPIEVSTSFTMGEAVEDAAEALREFWAAHAACATVTRDGASVTIDHGTLDDGCLYEGRPFAGTHVVTVSKNDADDVVVEHEFSGFGTDRVTLDGLATVTWGGAGEGRRVVHDFDWTTADGASFTGTGDRTVQLLDPEAGLAGGVVVDGTRTVVADRGTWEVTIDGIEARPQDPVPQAGSWTVAAPTGRAATATFTRLDDDTIEVVMSDGDASYTWHVTTDGDVDADPAGA